MSTPARTLPFDRPGPLEPSPGYAQLRAHAPVAWVTTADGRQAWLAPSHRAVSVVLSDQRFGRIAPGVDIPGNDTLFQDGEARARLRGWSRSPSPRGPSPSCARTSSGWPTTSWQTSPPPGRPPTWSRDSPCRCH